MGNILHNWDCNNPECESVNNKIPKHLVDRSIITKKPLARSCAACGHSPISKENKDQRPLGHSS